MILEAQGISKHFGGIITLSDISMSIAKSEIVGLIGPNGAGKTTFLTVSPASTGRTRERLPSVNTRWILPVFRPTG